MILKTEKINKQIRYFYLVLNHCNALAVFSSQNVVQQSGLSSAQKAVLHKQSLASTAFDVSRRQKQQYRDKE
jgi:hypothetical protein